MNDRPVKQGRTISGWRTFCLSTLLPLGVALASPNPALGQSTSLKPVETALQQRIQSSAVTAYQLQQFMLNRIPPMPKPATAAEWTTKQRELRRHILDDIAFHGWPRQWVESKPKFEQVGVIETGDGYRIRKLRFEIVPGFTSTALLYEPDKISGRAPAILNVMGHEPEGIYVPYEQIRCINFAKRGMVALDLGWMGYGDLMQPDNAHDIAATLNLVGSNALGLFYLNMRRGLDYLASLPEVDPSRLGVTGISGGGWQTVMLSALDPRVAVSVEVAGIGSRESNIVHPVDTQEVEEEAPDLMLNETYPEFVAMRAPKPTLLIHNAVDSCCFRASLVKPGIYDNVQPFFQLYGKLQNFGWHENFHPGVHNYQRDNRQQAYRFFTEHFNLPVTPDEIFVGPDVRSRKELSVSLPPNNLSILALAKQLASHIVRTPIPATGTPDRSAWVAQQRKTLRTVLHYEPVTTTHALRTWNTVDYNFQTISYHLNFSNGLSAAGLWFKEDAAPVNPPVTIVLNDKGYRAATQAVYQRLIRGEQILALNPVLFGPETPQPDIKTWSLLLDGTGVRPLGLEAAQLVATAKWLQSTTGQHKIRVETDGIRSQMAALAAAALDPGLFSDIVSTNAMQSLAYLLDKPVPLADAPDLFCLDLYTDFDIDSLQALASPAKISEASFVK